MRRKDGIRTERSEHECQWRCPSCLPNALALICCDMQLCVFVQNSFDADRQRRAGAHGLAARFVYVFRGVSERERQGRKNTGQSATSAECGARKLDFEMLAACSRDGCLACIFSASPEFNSWKRAGIRNVTKHSKGRPDCNAINSCNNLLLRPA